MRRLTHLQRAGIATTCLVLGSCLSAEAATVGIAIVPDDPPTWAQTRLAPRTNPPSGGSFLVGVVFQGDKEESNAVTVELGADHAVFSDNRAPVTAGNGCEQVSAQTVRCAYSHPTPSPNAPSDEPQPVPGGIQVVPGGGAGSTVRITGTRPVSGSDAKVRVDAGAAGATITDDSTGSGTTLLLGGAGPDHIQAGGATTYVNGHGGPDELVGGAGKTVITDGDAGHPDADVISGGGGVTTLIYRDRTADITVDLAGETGQGAAGENDTIRGIRRIVADEGMSYYDAAEAPHVVATTLLGSAGADRLVGTNAAGSRIDGRAGNDVLVGGDVVTGGPGDDRLSRHNRGFGGPGNDILSLDSDATTGSYGGPGDDRLVGARGDDFSTCCIETVVRCGPGDDLVSGGVVRLHPDCEQAGPFRQRIRIRDGHLILPGCGHCLRNAFITTGYESGFALWSRCIAANERTRTIGTILPGDSSTGPSSTARVPLPPSYSRFLRKQGSLRLFVVVMHGEPLRCRQGSVNVGLADQFDVTYTGIKLHFRRDGTIE